MNENYKPEKENVSEHEIDITVGAIELDLVDRMHETMKTIFENYRAEENCVVKLKFNDENVKVVLESAPENSDSIDETIGSFRVGKIEDDMIVFEEDFVLEGAFSESLPENFEEIWQASLTSDQQDFIQEAYSEYQFENKQE